MGLSESLVFSNLIVSFLAAQHLLGERKLYVNIVKNVICCASLSN